VNTLSIYIVFAVVAFSCCSFTAYSGSGGGWEDREMEKGRRGEEEKRRQCRQGIV